MKLLANITLLERPFALVDIYGVPQLVTTLGGESVILPQYQYIETLENIVKTKYNKELPKHLIREIEQLEEIIANKGMAPLDISICILGDVIHVHNADRPKSYGLYSNVGDPVRHFYARKVKGKYIWSNTQSREVRRYTLAQDLMR